MISKSSNAFDKGNVGGKGLTSIGCGGRKLNIVDIFLDAAVNSPTLKQGPAPLLSPQSRLLTGYVKKELKTSMDNKIKRIGTSMNTSIHQHSPEGLKAHKIPVTKMYSNNFYRSKQRKICQVNLADFSAEEHLKVRPLNNNDDCFKTF